MAWLVLAILVILVVAVAPRNPYAAIGVVAAALLVIGGGFWLQEREARLTESRIPQDEVALSNMHVARTGRPTQIVSGRISNLSDRFTLEALTIEVTMRDCYNDGCDVIEQQQVDIRLPIPPGQARDFEKVIPASPTAIPRGQVEWRYEVIETKARKSSAGAPP